MQTAACRSGSSVVAKTRQRAPILTLNGRRPRGGFGFAVGGVGVPVRLIDRGVLREGMTTGGPLLFLFVWAWLRVDRSISSTQSNTHNPHTTTGARRRGRPPSYAAAPVPWSRRPTPHATVIVIADRSQSLRAAPLAPPHVPPSPAQPSPTRPPHAGGLGRRMRLHCCCGEKRREGSLGGQWPPD